MINVISLYDDIRKDTVVSPENGNMTIATFNRFSRRAELRVIDYLTGDVEGVNPPFPFIEQKNRDWISHLIAIKQSSVKNGIFDKPEDYYKYDNFYAIEPESDDCDDNRADRNMIEIVDGAEFSNRTKTYIDELKPENGNYIATLEKNFVLEPKTIMDAQLVYIRYPKFAEIKPRTNPVYNIEEPNPETSINYEWPEFARELLIYFITDLASNKNTNQAMKEFNEATNKSGTK